MIFLGSQGGDEVVVTWCKNLGLGLTILFCDRVTIVRGRMRRGGGGGGDGVVVGEDEDVIGEDICVVW